jgi:hypothetical protein
MFAPEDYVAALALMLANVAFALATGMRIGLERRAEKPVAATRAELSAAEAEAETLNRSATFAQHAKKLRDVERLRGELDEHVRRRDAPARRARAAAIYWGMQVAGALALHMLVIGVVNRHTARATEEIVMVPHLFTSAWIQAGAESVDPKTGMLVVDRPPARGALPLVGDVRSIGHVTWYCCCLVSAHLMFALFDGVGRSGTKRTA